MVLALAKRGCEAKVEEGMVMARLPSGGSPDLVFLAAADEGLQVRHLAPRRTSLEDAFLRVVEESGASGSDGATAQGGGR